MYSKSNIYAIVGMSHRLLCEAFQQPKLMKDQLLVRFTILELYFKPGHQQPRKLNYPRGFKPYFLIMSSAPLGSTIKPYLAPVSLTLSI